MSFGSTPNCWSMPPCCSGSTWSGSDCAACWACSGPICSRMWSMTACLSKSITHLTERRGGSDSSAARRADGLVSHQVDQRDQAARHGQAEDEANDPSGAVVPQPDAENERDDQPRDHTEDDVHAQAESSAGHDLAGQPADDRSDDDAADDAEQAQMKTHDALLHAARTTDPANTPSSAVPRAVVHR